MAFDLFGRKASPDRQSYGERTPPGRQVVERWPVLHEGMVPRVDPLH
jgi:hypothetical protein